MLYVKVIRAANLKKMDFLRKSDPYVKMKLTGDRLQSRKTTVKMSNLNLEWNEMFTFAVLFILCCGLNDIESLSLVMNLRNGPDFSCVVDYDLHLILS